MDEKGFPNLFGITDELIGDMPPEFQFNIEPLILPKEFVKSNQGILTECGQQTDARSVQRINAGDIKLKLLFHSDTVFSMIKGVEVKVKHLEKKMSEAKVIRHRKQLIDTRNLLIECNLNDYDEAGDIYALVRTAVEKKNLFHIIITVKYEKYEINEYHKQICVVETVTKTTESFYVMDTNTDKRREFQFEIKHLLLPEEFEKKQCRQKDKPSIQRINDGDIKLKLLFHSDTVFSMIKGIEVKVKNLEKDISEAKVIRHRNQTVDAHHLIIECNLNEYDEAGDIYALVRTAAEKKKRFHVIVFVTYQKYEIDDNGERIYVMETVTKTTRSFLINGTNKKRGPSCSNSILSPDEKRRSSSIESMTSSGDSGITESDDSSTTTPLLSSHECHPQQPDRSVEVKRLIADHVRTKSLEIDGTFHGRQMSSPNGDIAYHFYLDDQDETFEEGQVVGFVPSTKDPDRKQVIIKLDCDTASKAVLIGVVTRSAYVVAKCPEKSDTRNTETICMMGIVPVQVIGSVSASEFLYSSPKHPGYAVSGYNLCYEQKRNAAVIGVAFSSRKTDDEDSAGFVEAGVSVLQCASQFLVNEKLRNIEEGFDDKIEVFKKSGKHWRRGVCIGSLILCTLLLLATIFMWQLYTPGSAYRIYRCELGRKLPHGLARYTSISSINNTTQPFVHGIEFRFKELLDKLNHEDFKPLVDDSFGVNVQGARYFLNLERCAYGNYIYSALNQEISSGPDMFAIDARCRFVYTYNEVYDRWKKNDVPPHTRIVKCQPASYADTDENAEN